MKIKMNNPCKILRDLDKIDENQEEASPIYAKTNEEKIACKRASINMVWNSY